MKEAANPRNNKPKIKPKGKNAFNAEAFLDSVGIPRRIAKYRRSQRIHSQSDPATDVLYIQHGGVKLSVVNPFGKEAVVAILGLVTFLVRGA